MRGFLDLLVDEAVLTEAAVREAAPWSPEDSAAHRSLHDRLVLAVALDSVLDSVRPQDSTDSTLDSEALGTIARERVIQMLAPAYDTAGIARVAAAFAALPRPSADSSLAAQLRVLDRLPRLAGGDSATVLARARVGEVRAGDVVAAWARLSLAYRPRIDNAEQVKDLVGNQFFERVLRAAAAGGGFEHDLRVTAALAAHAEQLWREGYVERTVLRGIEPDSTTINAYWRQHAGEWALPRRVRGIRLVLDDRASAVRMGALLADAADAESLAARAARGGASYRFDVSAASDSGLFRRAVAAGPGAMVGPVAQDGAWWVARVAEILPARTRPLAEVREDVIRRWYAQEAERRARELAQRLEATMRVEEAPDAAGRLLRALRDRPRGDAARRH